MGGGPGRSKKQPKKAKGKQRSGNPMKRKQQEQEEAARRAAAAEGGAFGLPGQQAGQDFELPDEFKKFMG
jgi:signal recognition particle subunit SRP54